MKTATWQLGPAMLALLLGACGGDRAVTAPPASPASAALQSVSAYKVLDLGTFGAQAAQAFGINEAGTVIGRYGDETGTRSFSWDARSGMRDLGDVDGAAFQVLRLNDRGEMAGWVRTASGDPRAVLRSPAGEFEYVGDADHATAAWGINDAGALVGSTRALLPGAAQNAFLWTRRGGLLEIPAYAGHFSGATYIDRAGRVLGWTSTSARCCDQRAFIWERRHGMTVLPSLGGNAWALAGNALGEAVGHSELRPAHPGEHGGSLGIPGDLETHAVLWSASGAIADLGTLGGRNSIAWAVGLHHDVYGWAENGARQWRAFRWTPAEKMVELPGLGGPNSQAGGVNARGMVAAQAADSSGVRRAVILIP